MIYLNSMSYKIIRKKNIFSAMNSIKADSLMGFIAGFLVGVIGMYVYVVILSTV